MKWKSNFQWRWKKHISVQSEDDHEDAEQVYYNTISKNNLTYLSEKKLSVIPLWVQT